MKNFEFTHFEKVVARENNDSKWCCDFYSHYDADRLFPIVCVGGCYKECVPYEGNAHLVNTKDPYIEPYELKEGDFVVSGYGDIKHPASSQWIAIVGQIDKNTAYKASALLVIKSNCGDDGILKLDSWCENQSYNRLATEEEKQLILSKLHKIEKDYNAEKKEIVDCRWVPNHGEMYYYPYFCLREGGFIPRKVAWDNMALPFDKANYEKGWMFRTAEECQPFCDKLNVRIIKFM